MGRKRSKKIDLKPWCWYCEREFEDEKVLIQHQKARHFKCHLCSKRLNTANGMVIHVAQVHKETVRVVPNAMRGRETTEVDIFGSLGVPEADKADYEMRKRGVVEPEQKRARQGEGGQVDADQLKWQLEQHRLAMQQQQYAPPGAVRPPFGHAPPFGGPPAMYAPPRPPMPMAMPPRPPVMPMMPPMRPPMVSSAIPPMIPPTMPPMMPPAMPPAVPPMSLPRPPAMSLSRPPMPPIMPPSITPTLPTMPRPPPVPHMSVIGKPSDPNHPVPAPVDAPKPKAKSTRLVYNDTQTSVEERRARLPKYALVS
ncbi:hypothetical protein H4S00_005096 [Coemansia sp. D1744]|nr:hypothetical protein H4S00_005096 [Coemansia sp. D1744]